MSHKWQRLLLDDKISQTSSWVASGICIRCRSWFQRTSEQQAEDSTGSEQAAGATSPPGWTPASGVQQQQQQRAQAAAVPNGGASDATTQRPEDCRGAFMATGAPGQRPPRPVHGEHGVAHLVESRRLT